MRSFGRALVGCVMASGILFGCQREILGPDGRPVGEAFSPGNGGGGGAAQTDDSATTTTSVGSPTVTTGVVTTGITTVSTGSTPQCGFYQITGQVTDMSGTATSSTGGGVFCMNDTGDQGSNQWESDCTSAGCRCKANGVVACTCTFPNNDGCHNDTCCPYPWGPLSFTQGG